MARPLRIEFPGALYHVTSRGNEKRPIVRSNRDRKAFLRFLGEAAKRFNWSITAWVLMTNHFHLVVETREANLSRGMHWFNSAYAGWYNHARKRSGHLYEGRFKSFLVEKEAYRAEVMRYVVLNPVRAKMVKRPASQSLSGLTATRTAVRRLRASASISPAAASTPKVGRVTGPRWRRLGCMRIRRAVNQRLNSD